MFLVLTFDFCARIYVAINRDTNQVRSFPDHLHPPLHRDRGNPERCHHRAGGAGSGVSDEGQPFAGAGPGGVAGSARPLGAVSVGRDHSLRHEEHRVGGPKKQVLNGLPRPERRQQTSRVETKAIAHMDDARANVE